MTYIIVDGLLGHVDGDRGERTQWWAPAEIAQGGMTAAQLAIQIAARPGVVFDLGEALRFAARIHPPMSDAWRDQVATGHQISGLLRRIEALRSLLGEHLHAAEPAGPIDLWADPAPEADDVIMLRRMIDDAETTIEALKAPYADLIAAAHDAGSIEWYESGVVA